MHIFCVDNYGWYALHWLHGQPACVDYKSSLGSIFKGLDEERWLFPFEVMEFWV